MSVGFETTSLRDTVLSHYLFDEGFDFEKEAEVNPRINELAQECLERLEQATSMPLIVTDQTGPVERLRSVFRVVMSQNTPPPTAAQRGNLAEYYASLKTQKNEELTESRLILWIALADGPLKMMRDYKNLTGNEVEVAFREWKTSLTINDRIQYLPPEIGLCTQLKHLALEGTYVEELPPEIGNLTQLESLKINYHQLRTLPVEIGNLKKLKELNIMSGSSPSGLMIPSEIGNLTELKKLFLRNNRIENVEVLGCLSHLKELALDWTGMEEFPLELCQLTRLTHLGLCGNPLAKLPLRFDRLTQLELLDIAGTEIGEMDPVLTLKLSQIKVFRRPDTRARESNRSIDPKAEAVGQIMAIMHLVSTMQANSPINVGTTLSGPRMCTNQYSRAIMNFIPSLLRGKNPFAILLKSSGSRTTFNKQ